MNNTPIIAIDVDDVLARFAEQFIEYSNDNYGLNLTIDDYDEWWSETWQVETDEVLRRAQVIHNDPNFFPKLRQFDDAGQVIKKLAKEYKVVVLTSRRTEILDITTNWLAKFFPEIEEVYLSGNYDGKLHSEKNRYFTKNEACIKIGASYLIDDQPKHCNGAAEVGVKSLLFGDYGWNRDAEIVDGVTRVADWGGVAEYFGV